MPDSPVIRREAGLHQSLERSQVVMIGLGGAIGTGLFLGSGLAIGYAGPAVLLSFAIAGFAAVVMVCSLAEMAALHPAAGSLGTYAEIYLNPWAGVIVRYTYWMCQVIAVGAEAVAAGVYMTYWFPDTSVWVWSLAFAALLLYFNSRSVNYFGTIEYWFASIKVVAIIAFIIIGVAAILGVGMAPVGFHNLTGLPGGFMPKGFGGVWMAVIVGVLSFFGIEVIAVTSGEMRNPTRTIPAALRSMVVRLLLFYVLALAVVVTFVPWTQTGAAVVTQSPFVRVFAHSPCGGHHELCRPERSAVEHEYQRVSMLAHAFLAGAWRICAALSRAACQQWHPDRGDTDLRSLYPSRSGGLQIYAPGLQLSFWRGAIRRDCGLDHYLAESFELSPPPPRGRPASRYAVLSRAADCWPGIAHRRIDHHGTRQRDLANFLDRRRAMAAAHLGGVLPDALAPRPRVLMAAAGNAFYNDPKQGAVRHGT